MDFHDLLTVVVIVVTATKTSPNTNARALARASGINRDEITLPEQSSLYRSGRQSSTSHSAKLF
jgi:hypothetical protein